MAIHSPASDENPAANRRTIGLFVLFCVIVVVGVVGYAVYARRGTEAVAPAGAAAIPIDAARIAEIRRQPHILFRMTALGPAYGRIGIVALDNPSGPPVVTGLACDRVHATIDNGLCLQAARGVLTTYRAVAFDSAFTERHGFTLAGAPSRTRIAPTAPLGASTVFVSGDSYASGGFSTRTTIFDLRNNAVIGDLETFAVTRDGQPFKRQDFNFWGVTFRDDGDRFYATLGTGGALHLVEGSVSQRRITVIGADVECPALSPDGTRVVYKARQVSGGRVFWRLRVLDLASRASAEVSETRNVDDQAEWLDNQQVLYALPREGTGTGSSDIWMAPADGTGAPRILVSDAYSPAVVRTPRRGRRGVDVLFEPRPAELPAGPTGPSAEEQPAVKVLATTVKDFSTGSLSAVAIAETDDGEVILAPHTGTDFIDGKVPQGWTSATWKGGLLPKLGGGMARLDGARLAAALTFPPGRSLELVATFPNAGNIHAGFAVSLTSPPWAVFSTGQGNALYARTNIGSTNVDTVLEGNWLGEPHRFRIDWQPKAIVFSIDGTEVATHAAPMTTRMRPIVSDLTPGGDVFDVDWIRMTPYALEGTFESRIFDAEVVVDWTTVYWLADEPAGTRVAVKVRGGNTPTPDSSWTPFTPVPTPGTALNRPFRYIQYRLELSTTERGQTPALRELTINGTERAAR
jgi:hypothetical protein